MDTHAWRLDGRVALIAGGAGAMGSATARRMATAGARVAVADIRHEAAKAVARELTEAGREAAAVPLDVAAADTWQAAVEQVEARFGTLTTMCYLAGGNHRVSYDAMTVAQFRRILELNLTGIFIGIKAVVPAMRRAGGGCIVSVGSLASLRAGGGAPAYACSKFGVSALTAATAGSYARDGIRCCQVNPGHVDTPFIRGSGEHSPNDWSTSIDNPANYEARVRGTPWGRLPRPEEIAEAFAFLASDAAEMITGSAITVDGGGGLT
jgi:NAD(P)-dependent dehydrogenase (short-subunit alcohol dehydrogenase family)